MVASETLEQGNNTTSSVTRVSVLRGRRHRDLGEGRGRGLPREGRRHDEGRGGCWNGSHGSRDHRRGGDGAFRGFRRPGLPPLLLVLCLKEQNQAVVSGLKLVPHSEHLADAFIQSDLEGLIHTDGGVNHTRGGS